RLLLSAYRQADLFRSARAQLRQAHGTQPDRDPCRLAGLHAVLRSWRRAAGDIRGRGGGHPVSMIEIRRFETLDSTNEEARRLAAAGENGPLWITALRQTGGRGRRGRTWISEPGNLFATLLLRDAGAQRAQLSFAAALAVADTVALYAPDARIALKW